MNLLNEFNENVSKLTLICRLCGEATDSYINIFGEEGAKHTINIKILLYLHVDVSNTDLLPKVICYLCFQKLEEFHDFFLRSKKVQLLLKNTVNESLFSIKIKIGHIENKNANNQTILAKENHTSLLFNGKTEETEIKKEVSSKDEDVNKVKIINSSIIAFKDFYNLEDNNETVESNFNINNDSLYQEDCYNTNYIDVQKENTIKFLQTNEIKNLELNKAEVSESESMSTKTWETNHNENSKLMSEADLLNLPVNLPCTLCTQEVTSPNTLIQHYKEHHSDAIPIFKCIICKSTYKVLKNFYIHCQRHSTNKYMCDVCGKSFNRNWALRVHASVHSDLKPFKCNECNKSFKNLSSLKTHKVVHLPEECKIMYTCVFCSKSFKSRYILKKHERIHTGQKDFICDICGKPFVSKSSLLYHISLHNYSQSIKCPLCQKLIKTERLLQEHLASHSIMKQFKCEYCGKEYRGATKLNDHRRLHTGELPYKCEYCQKCFRLNSTLIIHRRQHTGIKPYECHVCNLAFTNWPNYNKHMKRKHYNTVVEEKGDELIVLKF